MGVSFTKYLIFSLIILCGVAYGQSPLPPKDTILVLVTDKNDGALSKTAENNFRQASIQNYLRDKNIQYEHYYGQDIGPTYHKRWKVTHYPALVQMVKVGKGYAVKRTVSGAEDSKVLGSLSKVKKLLGIPIIIKKEPVPQQFMQQYHMPPAQSGSS